MRGPPITMADIHITGAESVDPDLAVAAAQLIDGGAPHRVFGISFSNDVRRIVLVLENDVFDVTRALAAYCGAELKAPRPKRAKARRS